MTDTTDAAALAGMVENALRMAMTTITGQDDDWEEIAMAQIEAGIDHAAALDAARIAAEQRAMTIRMLIEGHADAVSAKRLGVSPRTYAGYVAELKDEEVRLRKELFDLQFKHGTRQLMDTSSMSRTRKQLARVLTVIGQKTREQAAS